jgi:hypothetical protein
MLGQAAYHQYREEIADARGNGTTVPTWDYITPATRARWNRIGEAVKNALADQTAPPEPPHRIPIAPIHPRSSAPTETIRRDRNHDHQSLAAGDTRDH